MTLKNITCFCLINMNGKNERSRENKHKQNTDINNAIKPDEYDKNIINEKT